MQSIKENKNQIEAKLVHFNSR